MNYPSLFSSIVDIGSNVNPAKPTGVSCVTFDLEEEILWTGNFSGHITSFVPANQSLVKYTSFHVDYESDIRQIATCQEGILSLTKDALRFSRRRGITKFTHKCENLMKDLRCMIYKSSGGNDGLVYMAGNQEKFIELDLETAKHLRVIDIWENNDNGIQNCLHLKEHPRFICMANKTGKIVLRDSDQLRIQHQINSNAQIDSLDAYGNYMVAVSTYSGMLMIYDLRQAKLVSATPTCRLPAHIKFLSRFTNKCCIVSRSGGFSIVDLMNPSAINVTNNVQLPSFNAQVTAFDISATDQALAFGDDHNFVHIHGTCEKFDININRRQPEFADPIIPVPYYPLMADRYTSASEISPFPYYASPSMVDYRQLASYMPPNQCVRVYRPVPPIGPDILRSMRMVGNVGYVINSPGKIPNLGNNFSNNGNGSMRSSPEGNEFGTDQMPHRYHFLEPNHNKVDKDEYDFSRYNSSPFPGLDSTLPNSYANNMIQCLYFIPTLRASVINHICNIEYCLLCELGFLFHMLDIAPKHTPCQASNFLRAFRTIPQVCSLTLLLPEEESLRKQVNFSKLSQQWLRFLLNQLHRESNHSQTGGLKCSTLESDSFVTKIFSLQLTRNFQCTLCQHTWKSPYESFPITLTYPMNHSLDIDSSAGGDHQSSYVSFSELLLTSIQTEIMIQYPCENCKKSHNNIVERRFISKLPPLLAINTGLDNEIAKSFWKTQTERFIRWTKIRKEKPVVTCLNEMDKNAGNKATNPNNQITCRYGRFCKRPDCKFYHSHLEDEQEVDFYSWMPMSIFISKNTDSKMLKIKDPYSDWTNEKKSDYFEYALVNVTSVVKSSEDRFGNIVSAIKIDKSYFDARRKQLVKKLKRYQKRGGQLPVNLADVNIDSDEETDESVDENEQFTLESRNSNWEPENLPYHEPKADWYLFNHYSINPITPEEVVSTDLNWKVPTILMYMRRDFLSDYAQNKLLRRAKNAINPNVFSTQSLSISHKSFTFYPLDLQMEMPKKGDIVAVDAEFVMLTQEETELRSDGTRSTIKPSHKSVARISCVRGSGHLAGCPFIDDYISTQDQVADYMTQFSGIKPGDLDVSLSSKHLTTLKSTYLKLRFLIDNGVIFLGHGLRNDFKVINLVVPPEQVIDTVNLFQSPNSRRMVSLRFLAWYFFKMNIQSDTHDSVEDAQTALQLYHKYKELEMNNCAKDAIEKLYLMGKECGWKIPDFNR